MIPHIKTMISRVRETRVWSPSCWEDGAWRHGAEKKPGAVPGTCGWEVSLFNIGNHGKNSREIMGNPS